MLRVNIGAVRQLSPKADMLLVEHTTIHMNGVKGGIDVTSACLISHL